MKTIRVTEDQFALLRGAVSEARKRVFASWVAGKSDPAADPKEVAFYLGRLNEYDALISVVEDVLISDKSQDAEEDDNEDSEEA